MKSEHTWNRRVALEAAAQAWAGINRDVARQVGQDGTARILATADRMLDWLEARPEPTEEKPLAKGGLVVGYAVDPAVVGPPPPTLNLPGLADKMRGMNEAAARIRADVLRRTTTSWTEVGTAHAPPRNVAVEGDGSTTPPVYRFYRECVDPDCKVVYYWREDTRNLVNRWSLWSGPEPELGPPHWRALHDYDEGGEYAPPPRERMTRLTVEQLAELDISVESRYDTEE
jgi:hypothetical protein